MRETQLAEYQGLHFIKVLMAAFAVLIGINH
jgi:hypothetical protein